MSPTIYDIARVAGVSKSTVSRVLNKQTNISPEAREKVLRAIEDLHKCESKIKQKMIKGIIMLSSPADESFFSQLDKYDIPVVVIGKVEGQYSHVYSVDTDNYGTVLR